MKNKSRIRHSKFKNTGFLFELLTKQITFEILNNSPMETAKEITKEFFGGGSELAKELKLYNLLIHEKYNTPSKAEKFIDAILEARALLNDTKLRQEKYNLVKVIKENFKLQTFLASTVTNYRVLASIHQMFEARVNDVGSLKSVFDSKYTLVEHISTSIKKSKIKTNPVLEKYKNEDKDIRLLTYNILVETFNKKYTSLSILQKSLLREYINNVNNSSKFGVYYKEQLKEVVSTLVALYSEVTDIVTKIKLKETLTILKKQSKGNRKLTDGHVASLMLSYELIKELKDVKGCDE